MNATEIRETIELVREYMHQKIKQSGDHSKEIYLLSLTLKELNQLAPRQVN